MKLLKKIIVFFFVFTNASSFAVKYDPAIEIELIQYQGPLDAGDVNQVLLRVGLAVGNGGGGAICNGMNFALTGWSDLTNVSIYYTGQSSTFTAPTFLNTQTASATVNFTFSQPNTTTGMHYFWVLADVSGSMSIGNQVDIEYLGGSYSSGPNLFPATPNPSGFKKTGRNYTIGAGEDYNNVSEASIALQSFYYDDGFDIFMELTGNYGAAEPTTTINFTTYTGPAVVTFRPQLGQTGKVSEANLATNVTFLRLTGVSNIHFDGRPGGIGATREWTIRNTGTTAPIGSTINIADGSSNIEFRYINIEGDQTTTYPMIFFNTSTGTSGNSNNTISNCKIGDYTSGAALPQIGIYSEGTAGKENTNNTIEYCEFVDIWAPSSGTGGGIYIKGNSSSWTISNNHFYQTANAASCDNVYAFIQILAGGGYTIEGNYMGGTAPSCGGTPFVVTSGTSALQGIRMNTTSGTNTITNNTFANIQYTTTAATALYPLVGISIEGSSNFEIGTAGNGNIIGATTGTGNLVLTNNAASTSYGILGINYNSSGSVSIVDNKIGAITLNGTRTGATTNLITLGPSSGAALVDNNLLGNSVANNIYIASDAQLVGVNSSSANQVVVINNVFQGWDINATLAVSVGVFKNQSALSLSNNTFKNLDIIYSWTGVDVETSASLNASNNIFENITVSTGELSAFYIASSASSKINYNVIGGYAANNMVVGSNTLVRPITNQGGGVSNCFGNIIQNFSLTSNGTSSEFRAISSAGTGSVLIAEENNISNIVSQSTIAGMAITGIYLSPLSSTTGNIVLANTIQGLYVDNATSSMASATGIHLANCDGQVKSNFIADIEDKALSFPLIYGIYTNSGNWDVYNNVVNLSNGVNNNDVNIYGIADNSTNNTTYYHNTILLTGSASNGSVSTICFYRSNTSLCTIKNNVFQNKRSLSFNGDFAIYSVNTGTLISDYNYFEVSANQGRLGNWGGFDQSFISWKSSTLQDNNSLNATESFDYHGYASSGFIGGSSGTNLTSIVPCDKDGITRSTTPWMGAYEGTVKDKDCMLNIGVGVEPTTISSLKDTEAEATTVLDFDLQDLGTSDGLSILIDSIYFYSSIDNAIIDWTTVIAGAKLFGPDYPSGIAGTIENNRIVFGSANFINVADATTENYQLKIYLKTDLSAAKDNDLVGIQLDFTDIITKPTGSQFGSGFVETGAGKVAIDVVATELHFVTDLPPSSAYVNQSFYGTVQATDVNGNVDLNESTLISLALYSGTGNLTSGSGLNKNLINGVAEWTDLIYDTPEVINIEAQSGTLTNDISANITVGSASVFTVGNSRTYTTIQAAYNAIPTTLVDNYIIELYEDYDSNNETLPILFAQKTGHSLNNQIIIRPALNQTNIVVQGNPGASAFLWGLQGCDYVTIDGRPGGVGTAIQMTIRNTYTSSPSSAGQALVLNSDATFNTTKYLYLEAESGNSTSILFIAASSSISGNDNNTISNCVFRDLTVGGSSEEPSAAITSQGTTGFYNDNNVISNCEFINIGSTESAPSFSTHAIYLSQYTGPTTIKNNHFYRTTTLGNIGNIDYVFIDLLSVTGTTTITDNFIGGSQNKAGGTPLTVSAGSNSLIGIRANNSYVQVENNYIGNINYTTTMSTANAYPFIAFQQTGSNSALWGTPANGNTISNISLTNNAASGSYSFCAIEQQSIAGADIQSNNINNITITGSHTGLSTLFDIAAGSSSQIENGTYNNIAINNNGSFYIAQSAATLGVTVTNNTIQNIDHQAASAPLRLIESLSGNILLSNNYFNNISTTADADNRIVSHVATGGALTMENNQMENITFSATTTTNIASLVYLNTTVTSSINNNIFGGVGSKNIQYAGGNDFTAISNNSTGALNASGNIIQQIEATNTSNFVELIGIRNYSSGNVTATGNTIQNLYCNSIGDGSKVSLAGIAYASSSGATIHYDSNIIKGLYLTNTSGSNYSILFGLRSGACAIGSVIENNSVSNLVSYSDVATIYGIQSFSSLAGYNCDTYNNVVLISNGIQTTSPSIFGIDANFQDGSANVYHNTVKISGTENTAGLTRCFYSNGAGTGTINIKNNIFQNLRTGPGTHYAVYTNNASGLAFDYNYLEVDPTESANIGFWPNSAYDFTNWKTNAGATNSITGTETIDANGYATGSFVAGAGTNLTVTVPTDKNAVTRSITPWLGAYEGSTPLCGNYTIGGTAPNYATINAAVSDLSQNGISCACVFNIRNGVYNEQISIPSINGTSSINTITFQSESGDSSLVDISFAASAANNYTWQMNGPSNVVLNKLSLSSTDPTYAGVVELTNGAFDISITNCALTGSTPTAYSSTESVIYSGSTKEDGIVVKKCNIKGGVFGINFSSAYGSEETGMQLIDNVFSENYGWAISIIYANNPLILRNSVTNSTTTYSGYRAIEVSYTFEPIISKNKIVITSTSSVNGIYYFVNAGSASQKGYIVNNTISINNGTAIDVETSNYVRIFSNSALITSAISTDRCLYVDAGGSFTEIINNNFVSLGSGYVMEINSASVSSAEPVNMDFNNIYTDTGILGKWNGVDQNTITNWNTAASPYEVQTINVDPLFISVTDLHLTGSSPIALQAGYDLSASVPDDIDGDTRSTTPWMGADEYIPSVLYWYQDAGAWNSPAMWYYDAAGASPCACLPDINTDVIFNNLSLTGTDKVITFPAGLYQIKSIDFQGTYTPVFIGDGILEVGP